jgi:hypothetical protein
MKTKAFKLVLAALLLLLIGIGAAFADGSKRHSQPSYSGYYNQKGADHYRGGGQYYHRPNLYPHPNYYRFYHGGPPVRSYYLYNYYGSGYGNCSPGYGGNSSFFSGAYYEPGFGFSFGAIGR